MPPTPPPAAPPPDRPPSSPPAARPRHGLALGLAAASVVPAVVLGGPATASAAPQRNPAASPAMDLTPAASVAGAVTADQQPACGDPAAADFPIDTRIHGGPDTYASGGGYGTWFLDLTNTTAQSCRAIHPVLVLTDEDRMLTSDQIQLEFSERTHPGVEHRVTWETTDRDEHIGVFGGDGDDSFGGFTVPAGHTVTVQVRLAFTSDTSPGRITANAAIVQRQGAQSGKGAATGNGDGEWVGESEDYPFTVVEDDGSGDGTDSGGTGETGEVGGDRESVGGTGKEKEGDGLPGRIPGSTEPGRTEPGRTESGRTEPGRTESGSGTGTTRTPRPVAPGRDPAGIPELASTGISVPVPLPALTVSGLLIGGGAVVIAARRTRRALR
ncbi:hypothetical protein OG782_12995 [Streptomyces sp. NBC_00876]|uniref:hypothetical protein n=1 Tax=Streptomyces sp. NBC_00876 TaxID=2975853 RepID=UPI00386C69B5|nr:hypothetical protein OG782_12995 [Streptomyces sp. NBC_00876]